jgi:uncharacterized membrane protein
MTALVALVALVALALAWELFGGEWPFPPGAG